MSRMDKVGQAIKKEVGSIVHDELKDPRLGFITIMHAEVTKDLQNAKVYFSVLGNDKAKEAAGEGLNSASGFIRRLIGERLKLRYTPELSFILDNSVEYSLEIAEKIDKINDELKKSNRGRKKK